MSRDYTQSGEDFVYRVKIEYTGVNGVSRYKGPYTKGSVAQGIVTAYNNREINRRYSRAVLQRTPIGEWEDVPDEPKR